MLDNLRPEFLTDADRSLLLPWMLASHGALPNQSARFIGREQDTLDVCSFLSHSRLVVLLGPGGSGKTRLALEAAQSVIGSFQDGAHFISLAPISDPHDVVFAIARELGVRETASAELQDRLAARLRNLRVLLVLDNLEHLDSAVPALGRLLSATRHLKLLVTSRARLHMSGEQLYLVEPLATPERGAPLDEIAANPSVRLFVDRAGLVKPGFELTAENAPAVVELCQRTDGLPLTLELAAARVRWFSPEALLERFPSRLELGADGPADAERRHRTLRATLNWSYGLLLAPARELFRRMAVFAGGCSEEALYAVCEVERDSGAELPQAPRSLLDSCMVQLSERPHGELRFTMLETMRELALESLARTGEGGELRRRHAEYYTSLAETREPEFVLGMLNKPWIQRIEADYDNIQTARAWALEHDVELAARLVGAMWPFWNEQLYSTTENLNWTMQVLERGRNLPPSLLAPVLTAAACVIGSVGEYTRSIQLCEKSLQLWRDLGDHHNIGVVLLMEGVAYHVQGDLDAGRDRFERGLKIFRERGHYLGTVHCLQELAFVAMVAGEYDVAKGVLG